MYSCYYAVTTLVSTIPDVVDICIRKQMDWMTWAILISVIVGVIALLIVLPLYLAAYKQHFQCQSAANPYCWQDWVFLTGSSYTCPAQIVYGCGPGIERAEGYCDNNPTAPGCNCRLDENGNFPPSCICAYNNQAPLGTQDYANFEALCNGNLIPVNGPPPESS